MRCDRACGFVDVFVERDVGVGIDDAGRQIFASGIDYRRASGRRDVLPYGSDFAVFDIDAAVRNLAMGYSHDHGVLDEYLVVGGGRA